jgi:alpha-methylacyl-CoA racemase
MSERLEAMFAERPRDEWTAAFAGREACVTPVLSLDEAARHPHNAARGTYVVDDTGAIQPGVAPRFRDTPTPPPGPPRPIGSDTDEVLRELGVDDAALAELRERGVVG